MDVNQWYKIIQYAANKAQHGNITPQQFNEILMPAAQAGYLDYLLGEYQKYQIRRPIAVVEFGQNERIRNSLAPLIYGTVLNPYALTGIAAFPYDLAYPDAMWGVYGHYNIRFVQQDRLDAYLHSQIDPIAANPIYLIRHEGFQFFPNDIGQTRLSYVRKAPPIFWAYTLDANNRPVYDSVNSQQPVWSNEDMMQIIVRALALIGVNLQAGVVSQYAEQIKQGGQ